MADGGFVVKFDGKEIARCYAVSFDFDEYEYVLNRREHKELPVSVKSITVDVERGVDPAVFKGQKKHE